MSKTQILLVEDEPSIADAVEFVLQQEGFRIVRVGLIGEARQALKEQMIDFIVLDIGLPDGSGLEFCKEVRMKSEVPILFLTARQEEIDRILGLEIGADDYVTKPFSARELSARVKTILRRATPQGLPKVVGIKTCGPYTIDAENFLILRKELPLSLTKNEYNLLALFLKSPKRVFSRTQLMEGAWEEPESALERTVDAHIKSLRKKIGDECEIKTHRGFGYSLEITVS